MKLAKTSLTSFTLIILALLLATPVQASPTLSLGNTSSYNLTASVKTVQSCSATAYEGYACGTAPPQNITLSTISIYDNGTCSINTPTTCGFTPSVLYTTTGTEVRWTNNGRLTHIIAANSTGFSVNYYIYPGWTDYYTFQTPGTYNYHDANYPWLTGQVRVSQAPPPTPAPPTVMQFSVGGPVSWQVVGLDSNTALLNVTHNISLTVVIAGIELKPVTENGSFEQSIDLATRTESAGTASAIIKEILQEYASAVSGSYYYGPLSYLRFMQFNDKPQYTMWWVNGPLKMGSPVQLLNGYSSVRGSETVGLGGTVGDRDAWIVGSQFSQSLTLTTPPPSLGTTTANFALSLRSDYDQTNDLLLRSNSTITATVTTQTIYNAGQQLCTTGYPYTCITLTTMTIVTHQDTLNAAVNMQLTASNVPFNHRSATTGQAQSPVHAPWKPDTIHSRHRPSAHFSVPPLCVNRRNCPRSTGSNTLGILEGPTEETSNSNFSPCPTDLKSPNFFSTLAKIESIPEKLLWRPQDEHLRIPEASEPAEQHAFALIPPPTTSDREWSRKTGTADAAHTSP